MSAPLAAGAAADRPSLGARLLPWALSALLLALAFSGQPLGEVLASLRGARWGALGASLALWAVINLAIEAYFFHLALRWLAGFDHLPTVVRARAASWVLATLGIAFGYGGLVFYMRRRLGVPAGRGAALMLNDALHELAAMGLLAAAGAWAVTSGAAEAGGLPAAAIMKVGAGLVAFYLGCVVVSRVTPRLSLPRTALSLFEDIRLPSYAAFSGLKLAQNLAHGLWVVFALGCFGIEVPWLLGVGLAQIVHLARSLPITAFGLGVDQLTFPALYLAFAPAPGALLGFSLVYGAAMLTARLSLGAPFLPRVLAELREGEGDSALGAGIHP